MLVYVVALRLKASNYTDCTFAIMSGFAAGIINMVIVIICLALVSVIRNKAQKKTFNDPTAIAVTLLVYFCSLCENCFCVILLLYTGLKVNTKLLG